MKHLILIPLFKLHYFPTVDEWKMKNGSKLFSQVPSRLIIKAAAIPHRWDTLQVDRGQVNMSSGLFFFFLFVEFPYRTERWWGFYFNNSPVIIILSPTPEMIRRKINEERSSTENNSTFFLFPSFSHWIVLLWSGDWLVACRRPPLEFLPAIRKCQNKIK